jgi:hypothetical protein
VLHAKLIFQDECREGKGWDEPLSGANAARWSQWLSELPSLADYRVTRCLLPSSPKDVDLCLHIFCDASEVAYGAVAYLVGSTASLVVAKSRLAPLKTFVSIPRLELCAAVLAVKLSLVFEREMPLESITPYFWSDSQIVLSYVKNTKRRFKTFVANRVGFILEHSAACQWLYVPSELNPADSLSRGLFASELHEEALFSRGPEFLLWKKDDWPSQPSAGNELDKDPEVKGHAVACVTTAATSDATETLISHYGSLDHLKRAICWFHKLVAWRRNKDEVEADIKVSDMYSAEESLVRYTQKKHFKEEYDKLHAGGGVRKQSVLHSLNPSMDDSLLICHLQKAQIPLMQKYPRILPKGDRVSSLIVREAHEKAAHAGKETTLARLRLRYWVLGARNMIKNELQHCFLCKRLRSLPLCQRMSALPQDRVTSGKPPFYSTGVDCFGPFMVKRSSIGGGVVFDGDLMV